MSDSTTEDIDHFRAHFDSMYLSAIPQLLNETGAFLSFLSVITATDALAGVLDPNEGSGARFKSFIVRFYPEAFHHHAEAFWRFRNLMIHAFNPGPFGLVYGQSRLHLTQRGDVTLLNAEDCYAALLGASQRFFSALSTDTVLRNNFRRRIADADGGAPDTFLETRG